MRDGSQQAVNGRPGLGEEVGGLKRAFGWGWMEGNSGYCVGRFACWSVVMKGSSDKKNVDFTKCCAVT